ncbi:MAG TPA: DbpA RNA binding domain-containing protein, partial [Candidatus Babeliales bacterium]|nr:DbpA RNA binding domain-containing protein [Candidatus Babeliales bacterium]
SKAKISGHSCSEPLMNLLKDRSQEELVTALHNLISQTLLKGCATPQEEIHFATTEQAVRESQQRGGGYNNAQEIMLNVGTDDGINKNDILRYVQQARSLNGERVARIHVIKRRSFVTVSPQLIPAMIKELNGKMLRGRKVHASMA